MSSVSERLSEITAMIQSRADQVDDTVDNALTVSPSKSRGQRDRLRMAVKKNYISLDELNHVFQDITSAASLGYFDDSDAALIRQAASGLSDARRAIRRLANRKWVQK